MLTSEERAFAKTHAEHIDVFKAMQKKIREGIIEFFTKVAKKTDVSAVESDQDLFSALEYLLDNAYPETTQDIRFKKLDVIKRDLARAETLELEHFIKVLYKKVHEKYPWDITLEPDEMVSNVVSSNQRYVMSNYVRFQNAAKSYLEALEAEPETNVEDPEWGLFAFADRRADAPRERDTPPERAAYDALVKHFNDDNRLSNNVASKIKDLVDDGQYTKLLKFPSDKYSVIYRGMTLREDDVKALVGDAADEMSVDDVKEFPYGGLAVPRGDTASWTIDFDTAETFSVRKFHDGDFSGNDKLFAVVIYANVADNADRLILNPNTIYNVSGFESYKSEHELIGIGPINVSKLRIMRVR